MHTSGSYIVHNRRSKTKLFSHLYCAISFDVAQLLFFFLPSRELGLQFEIKEKKKQNLLGGGFESTIFFLKEKQSRLKT